MLRLRALSRLLVMFACSAMICGTSSAQSQSANVASPKSSAVPNRVRFQGSIEDQNGKAISGIAGVTFALYQEEQGGGALWMETQNVQADATGRYSVSLGANKPLPVELFSSGEARWLGVQVAGQKEQNRILLLSVPYALKAADAETVGGLPPSAFVLAAPPSGGNGGAASALSSSAGILLPATIVGTGTTNFLPLWTNATTLGSSALFQTGTGLPLIEADGVGSALVLDTSGNLAIASNMSKAGGSFKIDHPLNPSGKYLYHSFVESPDMMNIYNGTAILDAKGKAAVTLPDWFEALNRDFRYQLTALGAPGPNLYISKKVVGNRFEIAGGQPNAEVSWQVTGVRHDAWAEAHRIPVEVQKTGEEAGKYLHPDLFGLAPEKFGMQNAAVLRRAASAKRPSN